MDRRKFFKIFGGTAAAVAIPFSFKWARSESKKGIEGSTDLDDSATSIDTTGKTREMTARKCFLSINDEDYTDVCASVEMTMQPIEFVDFTHLDTPIAYREFIASAKQRGILNVTFTKYSMIKNKKVWPNWLKVGEWYDIKLSPDKSIIYNFKAMLTSYVERKNTLITDIQFEITGPVMMDVQVEIDAEDEEA